MSGDRTVGFRKIKRTEQERSRSVRFCRTRKIRAGAALWPGVGRADDRLKVAATTTGVTTPSEIATTAVTPATARVGEGLALIIAAEDPSSGGPFVLSRGRIA